MATLSYRSPGLELSTTCAASPQQIRDLQRDLRALGYLRRGIDGGFGEQTRLAVMGLQYDLLKNNGVSTGGDGHAPVRLVDYNRGRVTSITGVVDQALVACISDLLDEPKIPKLPWSPDPVSDNQRINATLATLPPAKAPTPYLRAVLKQETGGMHFAEPRGASIDSFIIVGTDRNAGLPYVITSRGYGIGQYTLFHHPPTADEVNAFITQPEQNVKRATGLLREKFDSFVVGPQSKAEDRIAEVGTGPLRLCKYAESDPRYMRDCKACALAAGTRDIRPGLPLFPGSEDTWRPTQYYESASYDDVPVREQIGCDWPYAVRRYNGGGINSYHYQARVLQNLAALD